MSIDDVKWMEGILSKEVGSQGSLLSVRIPRISVLRIVAEAGAAVLCLVNFLVINSIDINFPGPNYLPVFPEVEGAEIRQPGSGHLCRRQTRWRTKRKSADGTM